MPEIAVPVALVTGAARRIGAAIVRELHQRGYHIVLHFFQSKRDAEIIAAELNQIRANSVVIVNADLRNVAHLPLLIQNAVKPWGRLDVLINNASEFYTTPIGNVSEQQWDALFATNVKAPFFLCQAALPYLQNTQGNIINIIDIHAQHTYLHYSIYCSAKAALYSLTKNMARELAPTIRVNGISPGPSIWPEGDNALSEEKKTRVLERQPLKHLAHPLDIAKAAIFLLQNLSITGEVIRVDAGRALI
jgi:pteridine reductase